MLGIFNRIKINEKIYEKGEILGKGGFGEVIKAKCIESKRVFALKTIKKNDLNEKQRKFYEREVNIMKDLEHPFIIKYIDSVETHNSFKLLLQFAPNGNLEDYIKKELILQKKEDDITIFIQIVYGVKYLHSKDIAHRDLKPQNVLLFHGDIVKIADFGLANRFEGESMVTCVGTERYRAPEISPRKHYDGFKADLYSKNETFNEREKECLELSDKLQEYIPDDRPSFDDVVKNLKEINSIYLFNFIQLLFSDYKINVNDAIKILASSPELRNGIINFFSSASDISIENDGIALKSKRRYYVFHLEKYINDSDVSNAIINDVKTYIISLTINTSVNNFNDITKKLIHKDLKYIKFGKYSCLYPEENRFVLENECLLRKVESVGNLRISDISKINASLHMMEKNFSLFLCEITERTMNFPKVKRLELLIDRDSTETIYKKNVKNFKEYSINTENVIMFFKETAASFSNLTTFDCDFFARISRQSFLSIIDINVLMQYLKELKCFENVKGCVKFLFDNNVMSEIKESQIHKDFYVEY